MLTGNTQIIDSVSEAFKNVVAAQCVAEIEAHTEKLLKTYGNEVELQDHMVAVNNELRAIILSEGVNMALHAAKKAVTAENAHCLMTMGCV